MNKTTFYFDQFLRDIHAQDYHGLDDDMPDNFDRWLENLEAGDIMEYAEHAIQQATAGERRRVRDILEKQAPNLFKPCPCCGGGVNYHWKGIDYYLTLAKK
jgi:hypothetical protein